MVNYLYALDEIEKNHEAFAEKGTVAASPVVRKALRAIFLLAIWCQPHDRDIQLPLPDLY